MILCIENLNDATRKLLELINEFFIVEEDKTKQRKCVIFLHTNTERSEIESKEIIPFSITSKRIKCLGTAYLTRQKTCTTKTKTCK